MKSIKKLFAMGLAVMMALSIPFSVSAAELEDAPIDESRTGSLTIYKYDLTNAERTAFGIPPMCPPACSTRPA